MVEDPEADLGADVLGPHQPPSHVVDASGGVPDHRPALGPELELDLAAQGRRSGAEDREEAVGLLGRVPIHQAPEKRGQQAHVAELGERLGRRGRDLDRALNLHG